MKLSKNKKMLIVLALVVALLVYLFPLLLEFQTTDISIWGICIGSGCNSYSASSTSGIGGGDCRGYHFGLFFCISDASKYCMYMHPFEAREKCVCESRKANELYSSDFRKFCEKNKVCYTNSWEYEFGCAEDISGVCEKIENELLQREREYVIADNSKKMEIFNEWNLWRGFDGSSIEGESILIKDICAVFCRNCSDELCTKGHLCEYATIP